MPTTLLNLAYIPRGDTTNWDIEEDANKDIIDTVLGTQHHVTTGHHNAIVSDTHNTYDIGTTGVRYANIWAQTEVYAGSHQLTLKENAANKGAANGYAPLDGSSLIPNAYLPALAITSTYTAANEAAQLALTVQEGDVCVRTDLNKSYIALNATNASMADWQELLTPTYAVTSVNGYTGVVSLVGTDIGITPAGDIASTTVGAAINELDTEKASVTSLTTHTSAANPHSGSAASGANTDITSLSAATMTADPTVALGIATKQYVDNIATAMSMPVISKTTTYSVVAGDVGKLIDCPSGTFTITLLAPATAGDGFVLGVRNSGTGLITVTDGTYSRKVPAGCSIFITCDGTAYKEIAKGGFEIGENQAWQDVTASRALDTVYQNTTGRTIDVSVSIILTGGTTDRAVAYCENVTPPSINVGWADTGPGNSASIGSSVSFSVPDKSYYRIVSAIASPSIYVWAELR